MAARDFEDILQVGALVTRSLTIVYIPTIFLQCAIPIFTGLLPQPHDCQVSKLLFILAHWHGLAKLRMHTDDTIQLLQRVTSELGNKLQISGGHAQLLTQKSSGRRLSVADGGKLMHPLHVRTPRLLLQMVAV